MLTILEALRQLTNLFLVDPGARLANAFFGQPGTGPRTEFWTAHDVQPLYTAGQESRNPIIRTLQGKF